MLVLRLVTAVVVVLTIVGAIMQLNGDLLKVMILASVLLVLVNVLGRLMKPEAGDQDSAGTKTPSL